METAEGPWFVKQYGPGWPAETVHATLALQQAAAAAGLPVPRVQRAVAGEPTVAYAGGRLAAMDWVPGAAGRGPLSSAQAVAAGATLARLHLVLAEQPGTGEAFVPDFAWVAERAREMLALEAQQPLGGEASEIAQAAVAYRLATVQKTVPWPELYRTARWQVCHGDYYPPNLLFTGDRVTGVVDWDFAGSRWRAIEVARAAVEAAKGDDGAWRPEIARALVAHYHAVNPLSAVERVYGFRMWWEYLLWSRYPWPLPYTAPADLPKDWLGVARRRHGLMVWLGEHLAELEALGDEIGD